MRAFDEYNQDLEIKIIPSTLGFGEHLKQTVDFLDVGTPFFFVFELKLGKVSKKIKKLVEFSTKGVGGCQDRSIFH